jgi:hypothetical protein
MGQAWVGNIPQDEIVNALVQVARMTKTRAEDVATYTDEQWADLAGRAFGVGFGAVRLGVLVALNEMDDEIRASRRLHRGGGAA